MKKGTKFIGKMLIAMVLLSLAIPLALAKDSYQIDFNTKYGTSGTRLDNCNVCHTTGGGSPRNSYGLDYENGHNFTKIESLDSDKDGFSNIFEIKARTFPGNASDHPKDTTPPASITNLKNITYRPTNINWTWTDPKNADFAKVKVYLNGVFKTYVPKGKKYYNAVGLLPNTLYKISTHTVDTSGNVNKTWVNKTAMTAKDRTPPASITGLKNITYKPKYINWKWKDPLTFDFKYVKVYINGVFKTNVPKGKMYYNATGLIPNTLYKISTHTVDTSGNVNKTWVNKTARTAPLISRVGIVDFSYNPQTLKVSRYTTVTWKNNGGVDHTVTGDNGLWNSGNIIPGKSYSKRFDSVGSFSYHCTIHPTTMKGTITVVT